MLVSTASGEHEIEILMIEASRLQSAVLYGLLTITSDTLQCCTACLQEPLILLQCYLAPNGCRAKMYCATILLHGKLLLFLNAKNSFAVLCKGVVRGSCAGVVRGLLGEERRWGYLQVFCAQVQCLVASGNTCARNWGPSAPQLF